MLALRIIGIVLAIYLLGVVVFLGGMYLWLAMDPRRSPQARPFRAAVGEMAWAALVEITIPFAFFFWPWWWRRARRAPRGEAAGGAAAAPVVCVHGYGQNRADFWLLGSRLRRRRGCAVWGLNYWFFGSVQGSAARLARVVKRCREETGADRVHLVCHSMGGVVARYFIERLSGADQVGALVVLGSPLAGTQRAIYGLGQGARDIAPGSALLTELGPPAPPSGVRYHSVWSHSDGMVVPAQSGQLLGAGEELVVIEQGHLTPVLDGGVARQVIKWLGETDGRA